MRNLGAKFSHLEQSCGPIKQNNLLGVILYAADDCSSVTLGVRVQFRTINAESELVTLKPNTSKSTSLFHRAGMPSDVVDGLCSALMLPDCRLFSIGTCRRRAISEALRWRELLKTG